MSSSAASPMRCGRRRGEAEMSLVGNERAKLTANWLNTLASATATVGVLAPAASIAYGVGPSPPSATLFLVALPIWFYCALCLLWARDTCSASRSSDKRAVLRPVRPADSHRGFRLGSCAMGSAGGQKGIA